MRLNINCISNPSFGADLTFNGLITILHFEFAFSKAKDSIDICLTSESDTIICKACVNISTKKENK